MKLASVVAATLTALFVMACSGGSDDAKPTPLGDSGVGGQVSPASAKTPTDGLCLPAVPLAVSVGDTWTISGPFKVEGVPTGIPPGAAEASRTFTVAAIGTTSYASGRGEPPIEHPTIELEVTNVTRDADGNVLSTEDDTRAARGGWMPASVKNLGPALTPDWECHETAWLSGWPSPAQPSVNAKLHRLISGPPDSLPSSSRRCWPQVAEARV